MTARIKLEKRKFGLRVLDLERIRGFGENKRE